MSDDASIVNRYHEVLDAQREERLARWAAVERELPAEPAVSPAASAQWAEAREKFYESGPIPVSRSDRQVLADLKDRYRGERIFVLGNGPSLNDTPLHLLADEFTFCVNRIYLLFDRIRWRPTFYTAVDWRVTADCAAEINSLTGMNLFFPERFRGLLRDGDDVTWYWNGPSSDPTQRTFATDASLGIRGAGSVTGAAIQLAFHMGFDPIYLLGCDVSYNIPNTVVQEGPDRFGNGVGLFLTSTQDDDANHFDPRYFGAGRRWHDPNVKRMIQGFEQCREGADRAGRRIVNATVGGRLDVFERADVRSLFPRMASPRRVNPAARSGASEGLKVPENAEVAPAVLVEALLARDEPGLVVDIGAGTGGSLAAFAEAGWEVRGFEPDPTTHDTLVAALPPRWPVFVDPRALGGVESTAPIFPLPFGGGSLVPGTATAEPSATVTVVSPEVALSTMRGRTPDVVLISVAGWEREILRAYPFDIARPDAVVVDVDERITTRLGYRGCDLAKELENHGYEVFALAHRRAGPNEANQAVCQVPEADGEVTHLIALPPGLTSVESIESCRRAVVVARREMSAIEVLRSGSEHRAPAERSRISGSRSATGSTYTWDRSAATGWDTGATEPAGRDQSVAGRRTVPLGIQSIDELEGMYGEERVFVLGGAFDPNSTLAVLLRDEFTIATNDFHRHCDRIRWKPTFYVVARDSIDELTALELNAVTGSTFFFEDLTSDLLRMGPDVIPFAFDQESSRVAEVGLFNGVPAPDVSGPDRSLAAAIQIAYHLGFEPIYLVGVEAISSEPADTANIRAWHAACRDACDSSGREIRNTSPDTLFEVYKRADLHRIFAASDLAEFGRDRHAHIEETEVISTMFEQRDSRTRTMIDVGAHCGTSAKYFVDRNWTIFCFEPDQTNRDHLTRRYGNRSNLTIDARAVAAKAANRVPFFTSDESGGISSLSAFRESHKLQGYVDVTTIADIVEKYEITHVDFLKIDVEGFDFSVLEGVPWDRIRPDVIECEYEDAKTLPMGHNYRDIAEYLRARGYAVYVSEWHPVIHYGMRHDWRCVVPYPGFDVASNSWGNLLAFKHDPGYDAVQSAFAALVTVDGEPMTTPPERTEGADLKATTTSSAAVPTAGSQGPRRRFYADTADRLRARAPGVYAPLRFVKRATTTAWGRHRVAVLVGLAVVVGLFIAGLAADGAWRYTIWTGTVAVLLAAAILVVAMYAYRVARRQSVLRRELIGVQRELVDARRRFDDLSAVRHRLQRDSPNEIGSLQHRLSSAEASLHEREAQLDSALETIAEVQATVGELRSSEGVISSLESRLNETITEVRATVGELRSSEGVISSLESRLNETITEVRATVGELRSSEGAISTTMDELSQSVAGLESRLTDQLTFSNYSNAPGVRMHTRLLANEDVEEIRTRWLKQFGLWLSDRELRYLAHKICLDEERCEGRLATTIQAAMFRSLALLSIKSGEVELLEIGSLSGISAGSLYRVGARAGRTVKLTLIDPLTGYYEKSIKDGQTGVPITKEVLVDNLRTLGVSDAHYRIIQALSTDPEALEQASDRTYDYVLIDGDHSLQGVSSDFELYGKLVRPGGLLIFDDYDTADWPSIKPYVDDHVRPMGDWLWIAGEWRTAILKKKLSAH